MGTSRRAGHVSVRITAEVWREEAERFDKNATARVVAKRERARLEREGIHIGHLERCSDGGKDRTRLGGLLKAYVPIRQAPPSERPFGFVFIPATGEVLALLAFGERHPREGVRSVYERAHKRLHGRYPDQSPGSQQRTP